MPGKFITLGDGVTHYDVAGPDSGQRVMLVHGFSVPAYIWDSTVTALTGAGFRVARYDQFGRGYSDRPDIPYTADLFDRQLLQLLDSLGWRDPVSLVGLSNGGPVTANFTGRHPERVRSLTLVDPAAGPNSAPPFMFRIPFLGHILWQTLAVPTMADGQLTDQERAMIMARARESGLEAIVEAELNQTRSLGDIVRGVTDPAIKKDLYVLAFAIVRADENVSGAERIYLAQLAHQLGLDPAAAQAIENETATKIDSLSEN